MGVARYGGKPRRPFGTVPNETLNDPELSFKAKGLLAWLLAKPDDWTTSIDRLSRVGNDGERAIRSALKELEDNEYLFRSKFHDKETGRLSWNYYWFEHREDYREFVAKFKESPAQPTSTKRTDTKRSDDKTYGYETSSLSKKEEQRLIYKEELQTSLSQNPEVDDFCDECDQGDIWLDRTTKKLCNCQPSAVAYEAWYG